MRTKYIFSLASAPSFRDELGVWGSLATEGKFRMAVEGGKCIDVRPLALTPVQKWEVENMAFSIVFSSASHPKPPK